MSDIFFSIVIPTMDRHETLVYTIKTCLDQNYSNYEIIVCDNFSSPETRDVVESFNDVKIKYVRSSSRLAMTDNWNFAISHVTGEYVIVLGDDDALLQHTLFELNKIITIHNPLALRWDRIYYSWPSIIPAEYAHRLHIPIYSDSKILVHRFENILKSVANYDCGYDVLPMLYNSAISINLILLLKERTGSVFKSRSPDIYSGFAFAYLAKEYLSTNLPMSINAGSAKSNGTATVIQKTDNDIAINFNKLNSESGINCHKSVPNVRELPAIIADSFMIAKESLFFDTDNMNPDNKKLIDNIIFSARAKGNAHTIKTLKLLELHFSKDNSLLEYIQSISNRGDTCTNSIENITLKYARGVSGSNLNLIASDFGALDVASVARFCSCLMGYADKDYDWRNRSCLTDNSLMRATKAKLDHFIRRVQWLN